MEEIYIIGASGFGREVAWLIEKNGDYIVKGFIDDNPDILNQQINGIPVIGDTKWLKNKKEKVNVVIAIGNPQIRFNIFKILKENTNLYYPNIISKNVYISKSIDMGIGNIICDGSILTVNITIGDFNHINLDCTIGHDTHLNNFITIYPSVNVSGNVEISNYCELGTGSKIIQGLKICDRVIVGAGGTVIKNIDESGTYVGLPVKKIK